MAGSGNKSTYQTMSSSANKLNNKQRNQQTPYVADQKLPVFLRVQNVRGSNPTLLHAITLTISGDEYPQINILLKKHFSSLIYFLLLNKADERDVVLN